MINSKIKRECDLPDEVLIEKCLKWVYDLCRTEGKAWSLRVPVDMDRDPDILFIELVNRYKHTLGLKDSFNEDEPGHKEMGKTEKVCDLSDEVLIKKCLKWVRELCQGKIWMPVDDKGPDALFIELANRYKRTLRTSIDNSQEYLQFWEKKNNPQYPHEMEWDRVKINQFLADYEGQKTLSVHFVELGAPVHHNDGITELPIILKSREVPVRFKEKLAFRHGLSTLSDRAIDDFLAENKA